MEMRIEGWKYYNHAAIPTTAPHEMPDLRAVEKGDVWKIGGVFLYWRDGQPIGIVYMKQVGIMS